MRSGGASTQALLRQPHPEPQELNLSPSRVIKILFNQVSKENPFAQDDHNITQEGNADSEDSLGRYQELLEHTQPLAFSPVPHNQSQGAAEWDKIVNSTPAGRSLNEPNERSGKKLLGGVQRYSDAHQPYDMLKEQ
jgi:hypothetical protein